MKVHDKDHTGKNLADLAAQVFNKQVDTAVITSIPAQEGSGLVNHSPPPSSKNQKEMIDPKSLRIGNQKYPECGCPSDLFCECSRSRILIKKALNDAFVAGRSNQSFFTFEKEWLKESGLTPTEPDTKEEEA